jgi:hypothetical protein
MKKFLLLILQVLLLFSCKPSKESKPNENKPATEPEAATAVLKESEYAWQPPTPVINVEINAKPGEITSDKIPEGMSYKGSFSEAWWWTDSNGKNILILSSKRETFRDVTDNSSGYLFARQYIQKGESRSELLWEMNDFKNDCLFDLTCEFLGSPCIIDTDSNGIMETYVKYKLACRSDASPAKLKIIVHENKNKYALRGNMILKTSYIPDSLLTDDVELDLSKADPAQANSLPLDWGRYENANDFKDAPPAFLPYTIQLWKENRVEDFN